MNSIPKEKVETLCREWSITFDFSDETIQLEPKKPSMFVEISCSKETKSLSDLIRFRGLPDEECVLIGREKNWSAIKYGFTEHSRFVSCKWKQLGDLFMKWKNVAWCVDDDFYVILKSNPILLYFSHHDCIYVDVLKLQDTKAILNNHPLAS